MKIHNREKIICIFIVFLLVILGFSVNSYAFKKGDEVQCTGEVDAYVKGYTAARMPYPQKLNTKYRDNTVFTCTGERFGHTSVKYRQSVTTYYVQVTRDDKTFYILESKLSLFNLEKQKDIVAAQQLVNKYRKWGTVEPLTSLSKDEIIEIKTQCDYYFYDLGLAIIIEDLEKRVTEVAKTKGIPIADNGRIANVVDSETAKKQNDAKKKADEDRKNAQVDQGGEVGEEDKPIYKLPERTGSSDTDDIDGTVSGAEDFVKDAKSGGVRSSSYKKHTECFEVHL